ncbi:tRNA-(ms[2]io[6]A)-hydroxylase [Pedobacter sp. SD-b]|uniref:tRNA-(Ms[2]io[6]A)-hydroxylase n=1 Tax=Pedobacter segetis TaxID=2793069 RepID=A0ABS1BN68_9SPHI|nr:tRNA-(ms[2]io[6]A)-hydroxylase [Pedobacter segetis]MBK0384329.1 tRNA-(ms[2]io[6]A)-hydroxylase [Pedobacter segetis]
MSEKTIFKLRLPTDPFWVKNVVESNIEEILTDHAYCEQKAATNAITLIIQNPNISELVQEMAELVKEEMDHFKRVHDIIIKRGYTLGLERKDNYVNELIKFLKRGGGEAKRTESMVDRLLLAAMIEARSCERFKVLSEYVDDKELSEFYHELMVSEATHYTLFIGLARKYGVGIDVEKRWQEWLDYEGSVIKSYGKAETIHG